MWLTSINRKTGNIDIENTQDGVFAIQDFKKIIDTYGLECLTCVALTVDYYSPIRQYAYKERHIKAMRNVTGNSEAFNWNEDPIQQACITYDKLQFHPDLHELAIIREMRLKKIRDIESSKDDDEKANYLKKLKEIRNLQEELEKSLDFENIAKSSPVVNGYELSRLEQKVKDKNSFYHGEEKN